MRNSETSRSTSRDVALLRAQLESALGESREWRRQLENANQRVQEARTDALERESSEREAREQLASSTRLASSRLEGKETVLDRLSLRAQTSKQATRIAARLALGSWRLVLWRRREAQVGLPVTFNAFKSV